MPANSHRSRRRRLIGTAISAGFLVLVLAGFALAGGSPPPPRVGEIGPRLHLTGNGHQLHPAGRLTTVGDFPTGSAVAPGGHVVWVADCGHGKDDLKVVSVASGKVVQTLPLPGCYGGVAFAPDGKTAYVSGTPLGSSPTDGPTQGNQGDVVHVFTVDPATGTGTEDTPLQLPATTGGSGRVNSLPPVSGVGTAQPEGLAVSPNGRYVVVALNAADQAVVIDRQTNAQTTVAIGEYPEGVAFDPQGRAYVSNEYSGTVSVIDPASATVTATISGGGGSLGDLNSHPEGMIADPHRPLLYVAITNRDLVAVVSTATDKVIKLISVGRPQGLGTAPTNLAISPDDTTLYSSDAGEDALAVVSLSRRPAAGRRHRVYEPPSAAVLTRYHRTHRQRLLRVTVRVDCAGPTRTQERLYVRRVLAALSGPSRTRSARLRSARSSLPAVKPCPLIGAGHAIYEPPSVTTLTRYHRTHRQRLLRVTVRVDCAGPTRTQERLYVRRVLAALSGPSRTRSARLRSARSALPSARRCASGFIPNLPADTLIGRIPTAAYPNSVQTTPQGRLIWVAGKGFGSGPNPTYFFGGAKTPYQTPANAYGTYVLDLLIGRVGMLPIPSDTGVVKDTTVANAQSRPDNPESQPAGSPIPAGAGRPSTRIKHVFYIVRENRTYDQVFGSDPRGDGNAKLELFDDNGVSGPTGGITPNAHALTRRFPLLDHFYEDSEVSVDGHLITTSAYATDYAQKATAANYSNRRGTYDFGIFPVSAPPDFYIFDQAAKQNVSFRDYGEAVGTLSLTAAPNRPEFAQVQANVDSGYANNLFIGCLKAGAKATCTQDSGLYKGAGTIFTGQSRFNHWYPEFEAQARAGTVPTFNYMILPNDHTNGTTGGDPTPQAFIADNDLALGQIVDAISHSSIWPSTAIFVVEDDSQDGADHVDSHRSPALVISPWARTGAVVHSRYDQYSVLRTIELITGLDPLSLNDGLATPMYGAFISGSQKPNDAPYNVVEPSYPLTSTNSASAADSTLSSELPWNRLDAVPQAISDEILWASAHGANARPPGAGPNASADEIDRAAMMRYLLQAVHRDPNSPISRAWKREGSSCPITWACRPAPPGEG